MGRYLAPRGPDEETFVEREAFRVVFRRLAINDVASGTQPFVVADGRFVAVVNGEIYNHVELARQYLSGVTLASRSDCEVVVHLFRRMGARCLEKLNGIYSILIWDDAERTLLLARDRLGVKPLYYSIISGELVFASELKALLVHPEVPRDLDWSAFHDVPNAAFPYQRPAGREVPTGIEGVSFVAPASYVEWREGQPAHAETYWMAPGPSDAPGDLDSAADYVDRYASLLDDAVRGQLMSDVPVGLFLSGGLDSSLIGAIASRSGTRIEAFTLVEPSITRTGDTEAAMRLARHLGMPLHLVRVDQDALRATVALDLQALEYFVWSMDFPVFDVELLFKHELHRHAKCTRPEMKVILLGQGADEFAGGYSRISGENWSAFADSEARSFHASVLRQMGIPPAYSRLVHPRFAEPVSRARTETHEPWQYVRFGDLAAYNLWHEDRMAAANGMEARVPFLDHRLVELLCSIPPALREELFFDKAVERRAALRFLSPELTRRPKVPLFQSGPGEESISALRRSFVVGAFDDYREKYLESARALFSAKELVALRDEAAAPGGDAAVHLLCRCMTLSIFERICQDLHQPSFEPPRFPAAAPSLTASSIPAPRAAALSPSSRVAFSGSIRLALSLDGTSALLVIEGGTLMAQIGLPPGWDLSRVPQRVFSGGQLDIGGLARAVGVDVSTMRPLADAFVARGWGVLTDDGGEGERAEDRE